MIIRILLESQVLNWGHFEFESWKMEFSVLFAIMVWLTLTANQCRSSSGGQIIPRLWSAKFRHKAQIGQNGQVGGQANICPHPRLISPLASEHKSIGFARPRDPVILNGWSRSLCFSSQSNYSNWLGFGLCWSWWIAVGFWSPKFCCTLEQRNDWLHVGTHPKHIRSAAM